MSIRTVVCGLVFMCCAFSMIAQSEESSQDPIAILEKELALADSDSLRVMLLCDLAWEIQWTDAQQGLNYAMDAIRIANTSGSNRLKMNAYLHAGVMQYDLADFPQAIESYQRSLSFAESMKDIRTQSILINNIGNVHGQMRDTIAALKKYEQSLLMMEQAGDSSQLAMQLNNRGLLLSYTGRYKEAEQDLQRAAILCRSTENEYLLGDVLNNLGMVEAGKGNDKAALDFFMSSLQIAEEAGDDYGMAGTLNNVGEAHWRLGNRSQALKASEKSLELATRIKATDWERTAWRSLTEFYKGLGRYKEALEAHQKFVALNDSIHGMEKNKEIVRKEMRYDFMKQQLADSIGNAEQRFQVELGHTEEMSAEKARRQLYIFGAGGILLLALGLWNRLRFTQKAKKAVEDERAISEGLLLNILPAEVATELKIKGEAEARIIEEVTVLFTDFKGFTEMSEKLGPKDLIKDIHECFSAFDRIMDKHGVEKIKTIGDAYMAAGGVPVPRASHAEDAVLAALEIRDFIQQGKELKIQKGLPFFEIRIGIHTGPVVAGIVGLKKFQYDIWGDTVNTASRMESSGEEGKVNISEVTYSKLKSNPNLRFSQRGKIQVKGKGELEMFFVERADSTL